MVGLGRDHMFSAWSLRWNHNWLSNRTPSTPFRWPHALLVLTKLLILWANKWYLQRHQLYSTKPAYQYTFHTWALCLLLPAGSSSSLLFWFFLAFSESYYTQLTHILHSATIGSFPHTKHLKHGRVEYMPQKDGTMRILETYIDNLKYCDLVVLLPQYGLTKKCARWYVIRDKHGRDLNIGNSTVCSWVAIAPLDRRDYENQDHKHPLRILTLGTHI